MLRRKSQEKLPDEWVLQVYEDVCTDRGWDEGDVHVMVGKQAWSWMALCNNRYQLLRPDPEGYATSEEAVTAGLAAIKGMRDGA